jgi:hypothetical protein
VLQVYLRAQEPANRLPLSIAQFIIYHLASL